MSNMSLKAQAPLKVDSVVAMSLTLYSELHSNNNAAGRLHRAARDLTSKRGRAT